MSKPDSNSDELGSKDPKFVTALSRGLSVLSAFPRGDVLLSNIALAKRTGLPKATVTRFTYTLCKLGYLRQAGQNGEYGLTAATMSLGLGALTSTDLPSRAMIEFETLCQGDNANVSAGLGERHDLSVIYIATYRKENALAMRFSVGGQVPLFSSAIGRACLVSLSDEEQQRLLVQAKNTVSIRQAKNLDGWLEKANEDYQKFGFCTSFGDWREEINGLASPVKIQGSKRNYAVNVGGFSFFNSPELLMGEYGERLLTTISNLSLKPRS